jgi:hypothetical protein
MDMQSHTEQQNSDTYDVVMVVDKDAEAMSPDAQELLALVAQHVQEEFPGKEIDIESATRAIMNRSAFAVVVRVNGERAGYLFAALSQTIVGSQPLCMIQSRYVAPKFRSTEAYRTLVASAMTVARSNKCSWLMVECDPDGKNPAEWLAMEPIKVTYGMRL